MTRRLSHAVLALCSCSDRGFSDGTTEGTSGGDITSSSTSAADSDGATSDTDATGEDEKPQQWLLGAALSIPGAEWPLQWYVAGTWSGGIFNASMQPLALDQGSTTSPRTPVGEVTAIQVVVDDTGELTFTLDSLYVVGAANPISSNELLAEDAAFTGRYQTDDTWCGSIAGMLVEPIQYDLAGSTFAAVPVDAIGSLPLQFPTACK